MMPDLFPTMYPVACHTDNVGPGSTFVAIAGASYDGASFILSALEKGATRIVVQEKVSLAHCVEMQLKENGATLIRVKNSRQALAQLSAEAAGYPAEKLTIIGITGTKGKSTTTHLLAHLLRQAGASVALLSTVENQINNEKLKAPLTTAQPDYLHQFLRRCVDAGVTHVVMEVAAQAVSLHRVEGITFAGIIFTNFSMEHLEFYSSMDVYLQAKCDLFKQLHPDGIAVINSEGSWYETVSRAAGTHVTFGTQASVYRLVSEHTVPGGMQVQIVYDQQTVSLHVPQLMGHYNAYNVTAAFAMAHQLGLSPAINYFDSFAGVAGRLETYALPNGARAIIDYAHNPDSYQQLLSTLRQQTEHLIVVCGAGGKRDPQRRPIMGGIAANYADLLVLTSDNPRTEDPNSILDHMCAGIHADDIHKVVRELDREKAIQYAYACARKGSIIAILGKGADEYQIIGNVTHPFSERAIIKTLQ